MRQKDDLFARRLRAEKRFQRYGQCAIGMALLALALLLFTIVERGWRGFYHSEIRLTLALDAGTLKDPHSVRHTDFSPFIKNALVKRFPVSTDRRENRELVGLISSGATQAIRNALLKTPSRAAAPQDFWLPASDAVDRALKWHETAATPV